MAFRIVNACIETACRIWIEEAFGYKEE